MQRLDGIDPDFLWNVNALADRPHLAVILSADPSVIGKRLAARGPHNRLQRQSNSTAAEVRYYKEAYERLSAAGYRAVRISTGQHTPREVAVLVRQMLLR
ncbi:hypothetical protein ACFV9C_35920 [Kribbella sp. NPDC059898]|uniref:hypothetical protein n=1 Tax=Kribbella sp. NPDC059898 TaxID=3346995 RepID=UPI00365B5BF7